MVNIYYLKPKNSFPNISLSSRVGSDALAALSQSQISRYIAKYTEIMVEHLAPIYIRFPETENELEIIKRDFDRKYGIPGIVGVIDGTHVTLSALPHNIELAYINRKGIPSLNVQIVCDSNMVINNINARYPGSNHDSFIFRNSRVYTHLTQVFRARPNEWNYLLGKFCKDLN